MPKVDYETLLVDVDAGVATVTLNRPEARNALNARMGFELGHAFSTLDEDDDVRAIVVTGAGNTFCAGADLGSDTPFGGGGRANAGPIDGRPAMSEISPWKLSTPVLAAINGSAVGVGLTYALQWDVRIAAENAKLGLVFTRRGLIPEANSLWLLSRVAGTSRTLELLLTGRIFSGTEAAEMGLVSQALPADEVLPATLAIARDIAANTAPAAVAITKRLFYEFLESGDRYTARALERDMFQWSLQSADAKEGIASFLEKRPPRWSLSKNTDLPDAVRDPSSRTSTSD